MSPGEKGLTRTLVRIAVVGEVISLSFEIGRVIPVFEEFLKVHPNVDGLTHFFSGLFALVLLVSLVFHIAAPKARRLDSASSTIRIVYPNKIFAEVFTAAKEIRAYNPPLTLLVDDSKSEYRDIISDFLGHKHSVYKMIVGETGARLLVKLRDLWRAEHLEDKRLQRLLIEFHHHATDFHTVVRDWGVLDSDLRGFSFFLIDYGQHRRAVLFYVLGEPFAKTFAVPTSALLVHCDGADSEFYTQLSNEFDLRWDKIATKTTLSQFIYEPSSPFQLRGGVTR